MEKWPQNNKFWISPERDLTDIDGVASNSDKPLKLDNEINDILLPIKKVRSISTHYTKNDSNRYTLRVMM